MNQFGVARCKSNILGQWKILGNENFVYFYITPVEKQDNSSSQNIFGYLQAYTTASSM